MIVLLGRGGDTFQLEGRWFYVFLSEENIMNLYFSRLGDNLFALNQLAIMINSEFIISIRWSIDFRDKKTFISSTNLMYLRSREVVERLFMYSKNNKGPSIEPGVTSDE